MDIQSLFGVAGKTVVVTGGGRGIGKHITRAFVENGAKVYITSRDAKALDETVQEMQSLGKGQCYSIPADLQKYEEVERFVEEFGKKEQALHVLVNNAGAVWGETLENQLSYELRSFPDAAWTKIITLDLQRVFTLTQKLIPYLEKGARGGKDGSPPFDDPARIINIGSVDGIRVPTVENYSYSAAKAGLHHMSRVFANNLAPRGIVSNTLACGAFETKMMKATLEAFGDTIAAASPLQRIGTPQDVGGACIFLSSRASAWITGATVPLEGGVLIAARL